MRMILFAAAAFAFAFPAAAQAPLPRGHEIEAMAPAIDRAADALLELDVGPLIDAADPWRRRPYVRHRTLRDIARRDDPYFEHRLRGRIYGSTAAMARMMDAFSAAEPALRRSIIDMERSLDLALRDVRRPPPPPREFDEDWDRDFDDEGYEGEPYDD